MAADIADRPDLVDLDCAVIRHRGLDHFGEIAEMAVIDRNAKAGSLGQLPLPHPETSRTFSRQPRARPC